MRIILAVLVSLISFNSLAFPMGDTQGKVKAVKIHHNYERGYNSFSVWFSTTDNDRFSCIANDGYILVKDNGLGVDKDSFNKMFSLALTAQTTGNTLALSSSGTSPCVNVNGAWVVN